MMPLYPPFSQFDTNFYRHPRESGGPTYRDLPQISRYSISQSYQIGGLRQNRFPTQRHRCKIPACARSDVSGMTEVKAGITRRKVTMTQEKEAMTGGKPEMTQGKEGMTQKLMCTTLTSFGLTKGQGPIFKGRGVSRGC
jgi:hypothetical protein